MDLDYWTLFKGKVSPAKVVYLFRKNLNQSYHAICPYFIGALNQPIKSVVNL